MDWGGLWKLIRAFFAFLSGMKAKKAVKDQKEKDEIHEIATHPPDRDATIDRMHDGTF